MTDREIFEKETGIDISEWIQPDNVYCIDNEYIKKLYQYSEPYYGQEFGNRAFTTVTHWRPLPTPPDEAKRGRG